ncbi:protein bicaudal C homolog 1-A-like [Cucurbita moschata]|uniref:Protein bicaudal C homolog 1-A-like n=1 Tax=Cucurbita moschata TaxID=3662 RepID=A0A6J1E4E0_CUCMO|nr:protein bicaudal C homolog 1-A-like [Cucurbita moschata]
MADIQPPDPQINGAPAPPVVSSETVGSKRQRRPSVRLGDIGGDQPYDSYARRTNKPWKFASDNRKDSSAASAKNSKTRPLTNLRSAGGGGAEFRETPEGEDKENNLDSVAIGSWRLKDSKRRGSAATKRVRTNWVSPKHDEGGGGGEADEKYSAGEDVEEGYRDYDVDNSESPLKEQSSMHSLENLAMEGEGKEREMLYQGNRRCIRSRVSEGREHQDGLEFSGPSDTDARNWKCGTSGDRNGNGGRGVDGVRVWLNGLGLGRYAPVFEIHEVDDEVLPMLTLEDLKDMGITAVGSRRKMYSAVQKLGKGFS